MDWTTILQMILSFLLGGVLLFVLGLSFGKYISKLFAWLSAKIGKQNAEKAMDTGGTVLIEWGYESILVEESNEEIKQLAEEIKERNNKIKELVKKKLKN